MLSNNKTELTQIRQRLEAQELERLRGIGKLYKVSDVADLLDVTEARVYEMVRLGLFEGAVVRLGRNIRFLPSGLMSWLENGGQALPGGWQHESEGAQ